MEITQAWKILEMEPTEDEAAIKKQYHALLPKHNPEDDPEGFKNLREAYELALHPPKEEEKDEPDDEIAQWLRRVEEVYSDIRRRRDTAEWKELLSDPLCEGLDSAFDTRERLLAWIMSHQYLPRAVWEMLNNVFRFVEEKEELLEKFPENFIEYVTYNIENEGFGNYDYFSGEGDPDNFINTFYDTNRHISSAENLIEQLRVPGDEDDREGPLVFRSVEEILKVSPDAREAVEVAEKSLEECRGLNVCHPYLDVEALRLAMILDKTALPDGESYRDASERLMKDYGEDTYVQRICGEALAADGLWDEALAIWEKALEKHPEHSFLQLDRARYFCHSGELDTAEDIVRENISGLNGSPKVKNFFLRLQQLREEIYRKALNEDPDDIDARIELCWSCFHSDRIRETLSLLEEKSYTPGTSAYYDYVDMKGRCLLELKDFEGALKYLKEWEKALEELPDDGSEKYKKRKKTLGYQCFVLAECYGQLATSRKDPSLYDTADSYIQKALDNEEDSSMLLPYRDLQQRLLLRSGQYKKVVDLCDERLNEDKGDLPAYLRRQEAYFRLHNGQGVVDDYHSILALYKDYFKPYLLALRVFMIYEQYEDAESVLKTAAENRVEHPTLTLEKIRLLRYTALNDKKEEIKKLAETLLEEFRKDGPTDPEDPDDIKESEITLELGIVSDALGKRGDAMKYYERTVELDPNEDRAVYELARAYQRRYQLYELTKDYKRSKELFDRLVELNPSAFVYSARADLVKFSGDTDAVIADLRMALEKSEGDDSDDAYRLYRIGDMHYLNRRTDEAEAIFRETLEKYGGIQAAPIFELADTLGSRGRWQEALELMEKYKEEYKESTNYRVKLADMYISTGDAASAAAIYKELHEKGEWNTIYYNEMLMKLCMLCEPENFDRKFAEIDSVLQKEYGIEPKYRYLPPALWAKKLDDERIKNIAQYFSTTGSWLMYARKYKAALRSLRTALDIRNTRKWSSRDICRDLALCYMLQNAHYLGLSSSSKNSASIFADAALSNHRRSHIPPTELMEKEKSYYLSDEHYLKDMPADSAVRYTKLALLHLIRGDRKRCEEYLDATDHCVLCLSCRYQECYDALIVRAYIAEFRRKKKEARKMFLRAAAICPTDIENTMGVYANRE